jgi:hypothetical protein
MRSSLVTLVFSSFVLVACDRGAGAGAGPSGSSSAEARVAGPPRAPPKPAGPSELALVAPLAPGGELDGFEVREVRAVADGVLVVVCGKDRVVVRLWVALASDAGPEPPATAGRYAVFYSAKGADPEDAARLARALAAVVDKRADVPVPPGMTTFVPAPIPL